MTEHTWRAPVPAAMSHLVREAYAEIRIAAGGTLDNQALHKIVEILEHMESEIAFNAN